MKENKKNVWHFLILVLTIFVVFFSLASNSVKAEDNKEELIVGVPIDRCPMFYVDNDSGQVVGIGIDLMKIAAENAGYKVSFTIIKEETMKDALDSDSYDVVMPFGSAIKSTEGKASIVTDNLFETPFTLVTSGYANIPSFNELHVGMIKSLAGVSDTVKQMYPGMKITLYDTMQDSVNALRSGDIDALLNNSYIWSYALQKPSYEDLKVLPEEMFSMDFKAGTLDTEKGRIIIERLNDEIAKISDTQKRAIILDYTSRRLYQYDFSDYMYKYGIYILLISLLLVALIIVAILVNHLIRVEHKKKIKMLVNQDSLTGVLSLEGFRKKAEELITNNQDISYLLIYTNIKNFKYINDSLGKSSGDELLCFLAKHIKLHLSEVEAIGRVTADRFVILYRNLGSEKLFYEYDQKFEPVRNFFIDRGNNNRVLLCYGIYVLTKEDYHNVNVDRMIDYAHLAEKKLRATQNEGYEFYNNEQWKRGKQIAEVINNFPMAIKNGGILVWYQPQMDYEKGVITGAEALSRWDHEKLGFLLPDSFISILEETGLIYDLDCYVWEKVCQDLKRWNDLGYHQFVSVNVSRCDIKEDNDLSEIFANLIKKYDLTPDQLRIEITESAFVEMYDILINTTIKLRQLGFQVEMDDFGSGYSSLNMLKELPVDRVKLDLRFLTSTGDLEKSHIIIKSIIKMLNELKINVIAEGVETKEQADYLLNEGCSDMQGFYFSKAITFDAFSKLFIKEENN